MEDEPQPGISVLTADMALGIEAALDRMQFQMNAMAQQTMANTATIAAIMDYETAFLKIKEDAWRARKAAREEEKRQEREQERVLAQFRTDYGNQDMGCDDVRSAADVIVNYLTAANNYDTFKMASTAEKRRMIGETQGEMGRLGMDAATRSFGSVSSFITRLVRDCSKAYALENHTGEGLFAEDVLWVEVQGERGRCSKEEPRIEAFIRLQYPLWSLMKEVPAKRPAFTPLDVFDSGDAVEKEDLDELVQQDHTARYMHNEHEGDIQLDPAREEDQGAPECAPSKNAPPARKFSQTPQSKIKPSASAHGGST
ncbi:hypothetical protein QFC21_006338 [Naganishia friedmannii]|uniref:Uncharacterized protein n=1 Tax=Naganishia friedmannii TaxID=89922 RepID=A0ACC2V3X2_9TREE|nr:hypothetical protein QFC21_006338 [Naganishia friedmannii]